MADHNNLVPIATPKKNFMWTLCQTTMESQLSVGKVLAASSLLGNALAKMMNDLSYSFIHDGETEDPMGTPTEGDVSDKSLGWLLKEMKYLANQTSGSDSSPDQKKGFEMSFVQQAYSLRNTSMQEETNTLNNGSQAESQQAQQDNSNLQSLVTLASTGNGAATYAANLMQQTMA